MTGPQLAGALVHLLHRFRDQLNRHDWDTLHEASRRLHQHEGLVRDVLPDLRNRITELEGALVRLLPPGVATALLLDGLRPARENAPRSGSRLPGGACRAEQSSRRAR
jgi:hypothetical protein